MGITWNRPLVVHRSNLNRLNVDLLWPKLDEADISPRQHSNLHFVYNEKNNQHISSWGVVNIYTYTLTYIKMNGSFTLNLNSTPPGVRVSIEHSGLVLWPCIQELDCSRGATNTDRWTVGPDLCASCCTYMECRVIYLYAWHGKLLSQHRCFTFQVSNWFIRRTAARDTDIFPVNSIVFRACMRHAALHVGSQMPRGKLIFEATLLNTPEVTATTRAVILVEFEVKCLKVKPAKLRAMLSKENIFQKPM